MCVFDCYIQLYEYDTTTLALVIHFSGHSLLSGSSRGVLLFATAGMRCIELKNESLCKICHTDDTVVDSVSAVSSDVFATRR